MKTKSFVYESIRSGGKIAPILLPPEVTNGTGLFNPSIYVDNGRLLVNLRHCQYTFYHSEKKIFEHEFGPLLYLNPENDITLTTTNYICYLNDDLVLEKYSKIDTSKLDVTPMWEFIGLEDVRLFRWESKLYACGVRRDTTTNGVGRMELSELEESETGVREISRWRIPAPGKDDTYCEKNWMPILDKPYHFVKWSNPTEIVKVDPVAKTCETIYTGTYDESKHYYRGGSQVIEINGNYVALTHTVRLFKSEAGKKDAIYRHAFIIWDKNWNVINTTDEFSFMNADVEFSCGMAEHNGNILITFGYQDNAAYIVSVSKQFLIDYIYGK